MTPEEAEAFRAALENLLREHKVHLRTLRDGTFLLGRNYPEQTVTVTSFRNGGTPPDPIYLSIDVSKGDLKQPSQAPGRISPDTPW